MVFFSSKFVKYVDGPSSTKGMSQMLKILGVNVDVSMFNQMCWLLPLKLGMNPMRFWKSPPKVYMKIQMIKGGGGRCRILLCKEI